MTHSHVIQSKRALSLRLSSLPVMASVSSIAAATMARGTFAVSSTFASLAAFAALAALAALAAFAAFAAHISVSATVHVEGALDGPAGKGTREQINNHCELQKVAGAVAASPVLSDALAVTIMAYLVVRSPRRFSTLSFPGLAAALAAALAATFTPLSSPRSPVVHRMAASKCHWKPSHGHLPIGMHHSQKRRDRLLRGL